MDSLGKRILIIGCPGSGKTTLAITLARKTGLPAFHLDRYFWKPNWVSSKADEWQKTVEQLCMQPKWIIDGNYISTLKSRLEFADTVIFLDFKRFTCLSSAFCRSLKYRGRQRADIGEGCLDKLDFEFFKYIYRFNREQRIQILEIIKGSPRIKILSFSNRRALKRWINDNNG